MPGRLISERPDVAEKPPVLCICHVGLPGVAVEVRSMALVVMPDGPAPSWSGGGDGREARATNAPVAMIISACRPSADLERCARILFSACARNRLIDSCFARSRSAVRLMLSPSLVSSTTRRRDCFTLSVGQWIICPRSIASARAKLSPPCDAERASLRADLADFVCTAEETKLGGGGSFTGSGSTLSSRTPPRISSLPSSGGAVLGFAAFAAHSGFRGPSLFRLRSSL